MSPNFFFDPDAILWVDSAEPFLWTCFNLALFTTEHGLPSWGVIEFICPEIPIPKPLIGSKDRKGVTLFTFAQGLLSPFVRQKSIDPGQRYGKVNGLCQVITGTQV
jgi:hypothetical protein